MWAYRLKPGFNTAFFLHPFFCFFGFVALASGNDGSTLGGSGRVEGVSAADVTVCGTLGTVDRRKRSLLTLLTAPVRQSRPKSVESQSKINGKSHLWKRAAPSRGRRAVVPASFQGWAAREATHPPREC